MTATFQATYGGGKREREAERDRDREGSYSGSHNQLRNAYVNRSKNISVSVYSCASDIHAIPITMMILTN